MIGRLLPAAVSSADTREDAPPGTLFPEEEALVAASVPSRQREFAAVRGCARRAMSGLGLPPAPVLNGTRGVPRWPAGVVGSMTHCAGYRAAALARATEFRGLGIDAEPNAPLPSGILDSIALASELRRLRERPLPVGVHEDRLLFSAKESVFKTWFPLTRIELDFHDADITFHPATPTEGTLTARLLRTVPELPARFDGRWIVHEGIAATAITLPV
ncbi:4'-phosphopantetheinyl transferase [Streptomyces sp. NPDC058001]|uniref:4'-phosphopantetheinyl transferase family protein n=1 Tax=Streptomyces sp. NPDC058001 TaxID=3346300 RepID=UPI0036E443A1